MTTKRMATLNPKTTLSEKQKTQRLIRWAVIILVILGLASVGIIIQSTQTEVVVVAEDGISLPENLNQRIENIFESIEERMVETKANDDPTTITAFERTSLSDLFSDQILLSRFEEYFSPTPGEIIAKYPVDKIDFPKIDESMIQNLLISNKGIILIQTNDQILKVHGFDEYEVFMENTVIRSMQSNHDGSRFIVKDKTKITEFDWETFEFIRSIELPPTPGQVVYHPKDPDKLWLLESDINFSANEMNRNLWNVSSLDWNKYTDPEEEFRYRSFSLLGTMPQIGKAWAVDSEPYQIIASSGAIQEVDALSGLLYDELTTTGAKIDYNPQASQSNDMVFLRSQAYPEVGNNHLSTRAWLKTLNEDEEYMISTEPSYLTGISPDGNFVSALVLRNEPSLHWALIRTERNEIDFKSTKPNELFLDSQTRQLEIVELNFAAEYLKQKKLAENFPEKSIFNPKVLEESADFFEEQMSIFIDINEIDDPLEKLATLDQFFHLHHGSWFERDSTVYYLGAFYGETIKEWQRAQWNLDFIMGDFSTGRIDAVETPLLTLAKAQELTGKTESKEAYFKLFFPFYVARERIAGRKDLLEELDFINPQDSLSVYLVENDEPETMDAILKRLSEDEKTTQIYESLFAYSLAEYENDFENLLSSSLALAELWPTNSEYLIRLAEQLAIQQIDDPAIKLIEYAVRLSLDDPEIIFTAAGTLGTIGEFDKAGQLLDHLEKIDSFNEYQVRIEEEKALLNEMQIIETEAAAEQE